MSLNNSYLFSAALMKLFRRCLPEQLAESNDASINHMALLYAIAPVQSLFAI